jgi:hypothetical protein
MLIVQKAALTIDETGLMLRACPFARWRGDVLQINEPAMAILARPAQAATIRKAIDAWNRGEQTLALIALVHLGEPAIKTEAQVRAELAKAGYDPSEPRDDHGRWTSENGDDGSVNSPASPSVESGNAASSGLMPGVELAGYRPDYGQANLPSSDPLSVSSTQSYLTAPGINRLEDAQTIVEGMAGQHIGISRQCVALTRSLVPALKDVPARNWQRGDLVQGNSDIPVGTAIATFNYYNQPGTNGYGSAASPGGLSGVSHTGIYLGQDEQGITILNQWKRGPGPVISRIPWGKWNYNINEGGSRYYTINKE